VTAIPNKKTQRVQNDNLHTCRLSGIFTMVRRTLQQNMK
jgi:hypothetical protein